MSLTLAVKEGTRSEHEAAERSPFLVALLGGGVDASGYAAYLRRLRPVYAALESVGRAMREDRWVGAVHDPALERLGAIDADLAHWAPGAPVEVESPAAAAYVSRIEASTASGPQYVAHHYTRYLGDLTGGRVVRKAVQRHLGATGPGLAFFAFELPEKPKAYKGWYHSRIDQLPTSPRDVETVVNEARVAFELTRGLLDELADSPVGDPTPR
ncbi:biliverdin-producing heme oxygenase [Nocardioides ginkgobilobae]